MAFVRLKGLNSKSKTLAEGRRVTYWWAWKGGPRIDTDAKPGTPEFMAAYNKAVASTRPPPRDSLSGLVQRYRASPEYLKNADSTKAEWGPWLDRIAQDEEALDIGALTLKALGEPAVRADILDWRDQWASTPRKADYGMQVLARVLSWSIGRGLLAYNAAAGVEQLWQGGDRADKIWTPDEVARFTAVASREVGFALRLACLTGLRLTDLTRVAWSHVGEFAIVMPTGKSRGRKTQTIPLLPETRELLAEIRAHQAARRAALEARYAKGQRGRYRAPPPPAVTILTSSRCLPWSPAGLEHQIVDAKAKASPPIDKHLHDARGTFGTRLRKAGLKASEIADVLGWDEERVERLLKTYVDQDSIILDIAQRIRRREEGTE